MVGPRGDRAGYPGVLDPAVQQKSIRSIVVAPSAANGRFQWPSHREDLKDWQYPAWAMRAYEVDFGSN